LYGDLDGYQCSCRIGKYWNLLILIAVLAIYAKVYNNTKAIFTIGLMFFAGLLMLHNIIAVYAYFAMEPLYATGLLPYFVGI
jgi:riboflavin transporter FmnP